MDTPGMITVLYEGVSSCVFVHDICCCTVFVGGACVHVEHVSVDVCACEMYMVQGKHEHFKNTVIYEMLKHHAEISFRYLALIELGVIRHMHVHRLDRKLCFKLADVVMSISSKTFDLWITASY